MSIFFPIIVVVMGNKLGKEFLEGKGFLMAKNVRAKKIKKTNY